jgi:hypothetical protein
VASSLINFARGGVESLQPSALPPATKAPVAPVADAGLFQDSFEPAASQRASEVRAGHSSFSAAPAAALQVDSFEAGARAPVDLTGGVKPPMLAAEEAPPAAPRSAPDFSASLDDLEGLLG